MTSTNAKMNEHIKCKPAFGHSKGRTLFAEMVCAVDILRQQKHNHTDSSWGNKTKYRNLSIHIQIHFERKVIFSFAIPFPSTVENIAYGTDRLVKWSCIDGMLGLKKSSLSYLAPWNSCSKMSFFTIPATGFLHTVFLSGSWRMLSEEGAISWILAMWHEFIGH